SRLGLREASLMGKLAELSGGGDRSGAAAGAGGKKRRSSVRAGVGQLLPRTFVAGAPSRLFDGHHRRRAEPLRQSMAITGYARVAARPMMGLGPFRRCRRRAG